jgi:L-aspartate oxidase
VFGRRAALAALDDPEPTAGGTITADVSAPTRETREAVWRLAGLERDASGLRDLLEDAHPLARMVAASALAREETRGAHARVEFPVPDPALDGRHAVLEPGSSAPWFELWA